MLKQARTLTMVAALGILGACKGPEGPVGPTGPKGDPGPGTRVTFAGQVTSQGEATVQLPAEAGTVSEPPAISCYISSSSAGAYLLVWTDTFSGVSCGLVAGASGLRAAIVGAPAFWYYRIAVVY